jgi:hypothetical protein
MPQLVRVPHHLDSRDPSVLDFKRGRLEFTFASRMMKPGNDEPETAGVTSMPKNLMHAA